MLNGTYGGVRGGFISTYSIVILILFEDCCIMEILILSCLFHHEAIQLGEQLVGVSGVDGQRNR